MQATGPEPPGGWGPGAALGENGEPSLHACLRSAARSMRGPTAWRHESDLIFTKLHLAATSALSERVDRGPGGPLGERARALWDEARALRGDLPCHRDFCLVSEEMRGYALKRLSDIAGPGADVSSSSPAGDLADEWRLASEGPPELIGGLSLLLVESLQSGWPLDVALKRWSGLGAGTFSADGRRFRVAGAALDYTSELCLRGSSSMGFGQVLLLVDAGTDTIVAVAVAAG